MFSIFRNSSRPQDDRRSAFDLPVLALFLKDTRGGVLVYTALVLPVLLGVSGLSVDSVVLVNQIRSIDRQRLSRRLGTVNPETMTRVDQALRLSLGLTKL